MSRLYFGLPLLFALAACSQKDPAMEEMDQELSQASAEATGSDDQGFVAPQQVTTKEAEQAEGERRNSGTVSSTEGLPPRSAPSPAAEPSATDTVTSVAELADAPADYERFETDEVASPSGGASLNTRTPSPSRDKSSRDTASKMAPPPPVSVPRAGTTVTGQRSPTEPQVAAQDIDPKADGTEAYVHYGVNDMTLVDKDRFSTFAVDVDTASYAISRRKLQSGMLPPTSAVRVEEFVNAFHYDYPAPSAGSNDGAPFAVHMEAAPNPFDESHQILRVGVKGLEIDQDDREPMHLTFLVDTSGSMSSADKIGLAKQSLHTLTENLQPNDTVALVTYAGSTQVILQPTKVSEQRTIHAAIDKLSTGGGTHMSTGMELAYSLASETAVRGHENRVVVLSDGDANIGRTNHEDILAVVGQYAEEGITLSTIGFGMGNYKDVLMEQLANQGDGNYAYIDSQAEADKVFGEDLGGTLLTIAKDVKLQVEFNPEAVIAYRLIGYENRDIADRDFRNDRVDAGEIGSGHDVTALYDVVLRKDASSKELATVRVRAKQPGADSAAREWATVFDGSMLHSEFAQASKDFQIASCAATFAELLRGSPYVVEVSFYDLFALASQASRGVAEDKELLQLIDAAAKLSGERSPMVRR